MFLPPRDWMATAISVIASLSSGSLLAAPVTGEVTEFRTEDGVVERCVRITNFPNAHYSINDREIESAYCSLDFSTLALCPKLWSTSPGTILYEIDASTDEGNISRFERENCSDGRHAKQAASREPGVFKVSINARDTSATFAPASWVYYHLSRYFQTNVHVPVAVYRSMDAKSHNKRVVKPALVIVDDRHGLRMLAAGWRELDAIETGQQGGIAAAAVLTDDGRQIYGVVLNSTGDRYGPEFNGTRESGWGMGQNNDFQQTAPFLALRNAKPVAEAARDSIEEARINPKMAKALPADTPVEQVIIWMQEVLEITLLDFMLGQQDRIGNIDYTWRWYWIADGKLQSQAAHGMEIPEKLEAFNPVRLRQSAINDNDAAVRTGYADFADRTHMLEGLRHYNPELYQRLGRLAADLRKQGPAYQWLTGSAGLSEKEAGVIAKRTGQAFDLLAADCRSGSLVLDLEPEMALNPGGEPVDPVSCDVGD